MTDRMLDPTLRRSANEVWYVAGRASQADRYARSLQLIISRNPRPGLVYDLGSATGHFARLLASTADRVVGVEKMPERVRACCASNEDVPNLSFVEGDFFDLNIEKGSADVVTMLEMLYYVEPGMRRQFLDKVYRTLKPGGLLLVSLNVFSNGSEDAEAALLALIEEKHCVLARHYMHRLYYYRFELPLIRLLDEINYLEHIKIFFPHSMSVSHTTYSRTLDNLLLRPSWLLDQLLLPATRWLALALLGSKSLYALVTALSRMLRPNASRTQLIVLANRLSDTPSNAGKKA